MELPAPLRQAIDEMLHGIPVSEIARAATVLSERYRAEVRDGRLHMNADLAVKAYLATRMPATFAAVHASLDAAAAAMPDFAPRTMLDVGCGPGTVLWAAASVWPELETATLLDASEPARRAGRALSDNLRQVTTTWVAGDATLDLRGQAPHELVTCAYVLDEVAPASLGGLVDSLWALTGEMLVIVEPGTPAGWRRVLDARARLIGIGAHVAAPCPHQVPCPLAAPDWCHFARRVARSRIHRVAKGADVPWEDEKFIYLAASRNAPADREARVLAPPRHGSGKVQLKICQPDGNAVERLLTKRDGASFKEARRADWGDTFAG
ncbi:small ribosomal subunit Rsm22 family protein [Neoaquamicrobium sediminum]|uniref:small ribosomal subunit Rsm22 family protein n=1 Tax=Neoaquamicrobium sediminum TaxID=1849104 RepID=UPI003607ACE3